MRPTDESLVDEAMEQLDGLMAYRRRAFCSHQFRREVSLPQLQVLMELQEVEPVTVGELARRLSISAPSTSSIVDRMEEHGLVERVRNSEDRRVVHVAVTERGRELVSEFTGLRREHMQRMFDMMTADELRDVIRGLEAMSRMFARLEQQEAAQSA